MEGREGEGRIEEGKRKGRVEGSLLL